MAKEVIEAKYQAKDHDGNTVVDEEGKVVYEMAQVEYDFGDDLNGAVDLCGEETVFSNYRANAKVGLQSIIRTKLKAGQAPDQIQAVVDTWKPGMVMEKTAVDPAKAIQAAFSTWTPEKQAEFLASIGVAN